MKVTVGEHEGHSRGSSLHSESEWRVVLEHKQRGSGVHPEGFIICPQPHLVCGLCSL